MVLEEALLFFNEDDADIFIKFLRGKNCRVQKITESAICDETLMTGTIGTFIRLIEMKRERNLPKTGEDPVEREGATPGPEGSAPADKDAMFAITTQKMLENLKFIRSYVGNIMARLNPGDILCTGDDLNRMKELLLARFNDDQHEGLEGTALDAIMMHDCLYILKENGVAKTTPDGTILVKKIDPDELSIERRAWGRDEVDPETLNNYGIFLKYHVYFETATRVIIDPRIHFTCTVDEVVEALDDLETDMDSEEELVNNLSLKGFAIESILNVIETSGRISLPDLILRMDEITPGMIDNDYRLVIHSKPLFISGIINDLRRIGAVQGNDRKIRAVRQPG
jgi:hypothetical protein